MGFFDRLIKRLWGYREQAADAPDSGLTIDQFKIRQDAPSPFIEVYDGFGRRIKAPRDEWRAKVLLPQIAHDWDVPENLYTHVTMALQDGFVEDALMAARRLIDCYPERAEYVNALGCALLQLGSASEAQSAIEGHIKEHPPTGFLLTNLARAYHALGKRNLVESTLWKAASLDPNNPDCIDWLLAIARGKGGEEAETKTISKLRDFDGSWRAHLIVAKRALQSGDFEMAHRIYVYVLERLPHATEAMEVISADLLAKERHRDLATILGPIYKPALHGPVTGIALAQSYFAIHSIKRGQKLIHELFQLGIPEYQQKLFDLAQRFDELRRNTELPPAPSSPVSINLILLEEPLWRLGLSNARWFSPEKSERVKSIALVSFAHIRKEQTPSGPELEDQGGRLSRAIPLYLMEALHMRTDTAPYFVLPVIDGVGPAVSGAPWIRETLEQITNHVDRPTDFLVTGSIACDDSDCQVTMEIWSCEGSIRSIETISRSFEISSIGQVALEMEKDLIQFLELPGPASIGEYALREPRFSKERLTDYIECLGQSAALMLARYGICEVGSLLGERSLIGSALELSLRADQNEIPKLLFLTNLWLDRNAGSDIYTEFKSAAMSLLESEPPASALYRVSPLLFGVFDMDGEAQRRKEQLFRDPNRDFTDWLRGV